MFHFKNKDHALSLDTFPSYTNIPLSLQTITQFITFTFNPSQKV